MTQPSDPRLYVLDASAILSLLQREDGADLVAPLLPQAVISTINWAEVLQRLIRSGLPIEGYREELEAEGLDLLDFTPQDAEHVARLWASTSPAGLSLGDRACLSLAQRLGLPAFTADRTWVSLNLGVEVRLIR